MKCVFGVSHKNRCFLRKVVQRKYDASKFIKKHLFILNFENFDISKLLEAKVFLSKKKLSPKIELADSIQEDAWLKEDLYLTIIRLAFQTAQKLLKQ